MTSQAVNAYKEFRNGRVYPSAFLPLPVFHFLPPLSLHSSLPSTLQSFLVPLFPSALLHHCPLPYLLLFFSWIFLIRLGARGSVLSSPSGSRQNPVAHSIWAHFEVVGIHFTSGVTHTQIITFYSGKNAYIQWGFESPNSEVESFVIYMAFLLQIFANSSVVRTRPPASFYSSQVLLFNTSWTGFTGFQSALGLTSKSPFWLTRLCLLAIRCIFVN